MGKGPQKITILALAIALLVGCAPATNLLYGPSMTPTQIEDAVYQDAFAIGAMWVAKDKSKAEDLVTAAQDMKDQMDNEMNISAVLTDAWVQALKKGDTNDAFMLFAIQRLYGRLGITIKGPDIDTSKVDKALLYSAADAFIAGVQSQL